MTVAIEPPLMAPTVIDRGVMRIEVARHDGLQRQHEA